ncbi:alpha-N-acetylgalactosaminidase-like [Cimex lectularius]|uniref:Alpha-galactosidase n=1 Tax=Cimex lectularius TaxID=79782 RepID=A0A8I6TG05_CIMLE|nr:alpha-N-acetylgalactosaminidase-like [Cimex lectularius]XP_024081895.1 alpha-N-acetylgalactosaminidase-like [Cimex lectularius]
MKLRGILVVFIVFQGAYALDNGLALTPPMGWMTWQRFRCNTDCTKYPDECISEKLIRRTADAMVREGYLEAGYEYIVIDDCWLDMNRTSTGNLQANYTRFPHGMVSLINYVHMKGLKFGIYENYGNKTCAGYPGLYGYEKEDAYMFAEWQIDYLKVDGCYYYGKEYAADYEKFKRILNQTGHPIVYSCSYPAYTDMESIPTDFSILSENCNLWRNYDDIQDSWNSVTDILDYFALKQDYIAQFAGPGHWNDPDMLLIGNFGLSYEQSKVQMALWSILAAPLLMSTDLDKIRPEYADILKNKKIIAVNQDPLGIQGLRVLRQNKIEVWTRKVTPANDTEYSYAIAIYSRRTDGSPYEFVTTLEKIGLKYAKGYTLEDLYDEVQYTPVYYPESTLTIRVNPSGVVFMKASLVLTP